LRGSAPALYAAVDANAEQKERHRPA